MPPRSRRQDIETKECTICVEVRPVYRNFPTFTSCNHPPDTCLTCVSRHAVTQLEANPTWNSCTCAQCNIALPTEELQVVLPRAIFKETNALVARKDMESDEAWRWCLNPSCGYGQLQKPKKTENKVACKKCGFCICFKHQVPWHTGYTCWNYDTSHPESQAVQSSEKVIGDISKACPGPPGGKGCGWRVQKNGGCLHMRCKCYGTLDMCHGFLTGLLQVQNAALIGLGILFPSMERLHQPVLSIVAVQHFLDR